MQMLCPVETFHVELARWGALAACPASRFLTFLEPCFEQYTHVTHVLNSIPPELHPHSPNHCIWDVILNCRKLNLSISWARVYVVVLEQNISLQKRPWSRNSPFGRLKDRNTRWGRSHSRVCGRVLCNMHVDHWDQQRKRRFHVGLWAVLGWPYNMRESTSLSTYLGRLCNEVFTKDQLSSSSHFRSRSGQVKKKSMFT